MSSGRAGSEVCIRKSVTTLERSVGIKYLDLVQDRIREDILVVLEDGKLLLWLGFYLRCLFGRRLGDRACGVCGVWLRLN